VYAAAQGFWHRDPAHMQCGSCYSLLCESEPAGGPDGGERAAGVLRACGAVILKVYFLLWRFTYSKAQANPRAPPPVRLLFWEPAFLLLAVYYCE
jgi:hypothetical protein